jgi:hypothetical protein
MVHAVRIKGGGAAYSNRLVKTHRLTHEKRRGYAMYQRVRIFYFLFFILFFHAAMPCTSGCTCCPACASARSSMHQSR